MTNSIHVGLVLILGAVLASASPGYAATFTVDSTIDAVDVTPGDGICATAGAVCTLRAAIQEANALAGTDTINLPAGTYTLTIAGANENAGATGDLDITSTIVIAGAGADVTTVNAGGLDRAFDIAVAGNAVIRGLTVAGGSPGAPGGGIAVNGVLLLDRSAVVGNTGTFGGGIASLGGGSITITDSAISGNAAAGQGGGLNLQGSGPQTLTNVTISSNSAGAGGGLVAFNGITLTNVTIAANADAGVTAHSFALGSGTATLRNTLIVASAAGANCLIASTLVDSGGNFAASAACGIIPATAAVAANLGPLALNAPGTTSTHALLAGNPAIGGGVAASCPAVDQRGAARLPTACDSGAYQFSVFAAVQNVPALNPLSMLLLALLLALVARRQGPGGRPRPR